MESTTKVERESLPLEVVLVWAFYLLDAAVMLEAGWSDLCDRLVYVDAPREVRLQRLARQRGGTSRLRLHREHAGPAAFERRTGLRPK